MTLKQLAIRTKKSLSGLYSFDNGKHSSLPETPKKASTTATENASPRLARSGLSKTSQSSPALESPSRRQRLLGSIRSMGSLRSLRSNRSSGSDVPRSSPIPVPSSAKQSASNLHSTSPEPPFVVGTVPDSPAPLRKTSVQESILNHALVNTSDTSPASDHIGPFSDPIPTPMPGTNLSLEDLRNCSIVSLSTLPPSMQDGTEEDYFAFSPIKPAHVESSQCHASSRACHDSKTGAVTSAAVATTDVVVGNAQATPPPGKLEPMGSEAGQLADVNNDPFALEPSRRSSEHCELRADLAYIVWDEPECRAEPSKLGRRRSTWGRHTGLYDGTGYGGETASSPPRPSNSDNTGGETEATDFTVPDQAPPDSAHLETSAEPNKPSAASEPTPPADDKETLQDIIRAYAGPMLYHEEAEHAQAIQHSGDVDSVYDLPTDLKEEVALSIRVMDRSLGG